MHTSLYVISDLHLGGAPAADGSRGFQICPPHTQALLARFIDRLPGRPGGAEAKADADADADCRLVIAGDIVDFLAEEPFEAFTADPAAARRKLEAILDHTAPVWQALRRFVTERDGALTLMLGNHDIELSLPAARQLLLERIGPGRIDFIYDNEAFTLGPVLIEHGNRFDAWNAVPHGALRRVRSQLSRRLPPKPDFPALPGSRLVTEVMNPLKKDYPFVDLLKPEDAGALPILAALGAGGWRDAWNFFGNFRRQWSRDYDENREPLDEEFIASPADGDQAMFDLAEDIAAGGDAGQVSAIGDLLKGAAGAVSDRVRAARRAALYKALRGQRDLHRDTFAVEREIDTYLRPARQAAAAGFRVVVYGHTHLAKRIALGDAAAGTATVAATAGATSTSASTGTGAGTGTSAGTGTEVGAGAAVYLNTGTWADLMRVPDAVWEGDEAARRAALEAFVDDLERSALDRWRRPVPTYARIEVEGDAVQSADVHFADDDERLATEALLRRLSAGPGEADASSAGAGHA